MAIYIDYSSAALISDIKTRAMLPTSQNLFSDTVLCKMITEELFADIVPLIMAVREEFFVQYYDQAISGVSYDIPVRAIGQKLRDVCLLNSNSKECYIQRLNPDTEKRRRSEYNPIYARGFYFRDDLVILHPDAASFSGFTLRQKYFRRPNNVCTTIEGGKVTAINTGTKVVTLSYMPSTWTSADTFDCIMGQPGFKSRGDDLTVTGLDVAARTLTFATLPTGLAVGDWFAHSGFSPIAQVPYEVHNILCQRVAVKVLESLGDTEGLKNAADVYKDMVSKFQTMLSPRADGSPKRIVRNNPLFGGGGPRSPGWW